MPRKLTKIQSYPGSTARLTVRLSDYETQSVNDMLHTLACWGCPANPSELIRRAIHRFYADGNWMDGSRTIARKLQIDVQKDLDKLHQQRLAASGQKKEETNAQHAVLEQRRSDAIQREGGLAQQPVQRSGKSAGTSQAKDGHKTGSNGGRARETQRPARRGGRSKVTP